MDNTSPSPPIEVPSLFSTIKGSVSVIKDILPWMMVLYNMVFGFGVKQSTSDHNQELLMQDHATLQELRTAQELLMQDHATLQELRTAQADITKQQSSLEAKVDLLVTATFQRGHDAK